MDNCDWLKYVVPDFVNPYLNKTGGWPAVEAGCALTGKYGALLCAWSMAEYHIKNDLVPALSKTGCGSDTDWNKVFDIIETCSKPNVPLSWVAAQMVFRYRQDARNKCIAQRSAAGLPTAVNPSAQGLVCTP